MQATVTFFDKTEELEKLTGLNREELWNNGFNLDDWDWGFCSTEPFGSIELDECGEPYHRHDYFDSNVPRAISHILEWMDMYCCGYECVLYNNMYYFILYHA